MSDATRTTVYFDPALHRALRMKAAESGRSMSDMVNEAVRASLAEDLEDLEAIDRRAEEPSRSFREFLNELKDEGLV